MGTCNLMMLLITMTTILLCVHSISADTNVEYCCDDFVMESKPSPAVPALTTDIITIQASCTCKTKNVTFCPGIYVGEEAEDQVTLAKNYEKANESCTLKAVVTVLQRQFKRRSIEVPLTCQELKGKHDITYRFEKSGNKEKCNEDVDCWYFEEQLCVKNLCSCYDDQPSFIEEEGKCYPASAYGERCFYDEQCMSKDGNTTCVDNRCACKKNYWIKSDVNPTCITSISANLVPSHLLIVGSIFFSMIMILIAK